MGHLQAGAITDQARSGATSRWRASTQATATLALAPHRARAGADPVHVASCIDPSLDPRQFTRALMAGWLHLGMTEAIDVPVSAQAQRLNSLTGDPLGNDL